MQILAIGENKKTSVFQQGFTLVEVLVTMVIFGLMTGAVIMNLPPKEDPLETQVRQLTTRLQMLAQTSLIARQQTGVMLTKEGYELVRYQNGSWQTIEQFDFDLTNAPALEFIQNARKVNLKTAVKSGIPIIRYDTTGLATPFELNLQGAQNTIRIIGSIDGSVQVSGDGEN